MVRGLGLGIRLLADHKLRLLAAAAGIAMAVTIMFVEIGLLYAVLDSQALIASLVRGDLVVMNRARTNLHKWNSVDQIRLGQIAAMAGVERVIPIYEGALGMRNPDDLRIRRIVVFAVPPDDIPLDLGAPAEMARLRDNPNGILFDRRSRPIFGNIVPGQDIELDGTRQRVVGYADIGPDIVNDGALVMSEGAWLVRSHGDQPIMGAIRLRPGVDPAAARDRILARLPQDVTILTPDEVRAREIDFTLRAAPIGILFGIGMLAGLVIGSITCYQILFNEVVDRLRQYATLNAMGFSRLFLLRIILEQAALLSWLGFAAGLLVAQALALYIARATALPMAVGTTLAAVVLAVTMAMCGLAGLLAVRRVTTADPAALY